MTSARLSPEWFDCVLPAHYLRQRLDYDPATGLFVWRDFEGVPDSWRTRWAGKPAMNIRSHDGYLFGFVGAVRVRAHRVAWAISTGRWPVGQIDHINNHRADNRIGNLRDVSASFNQRNRACPLVGIYRRPSGSFSVRMKVAGRDVSFGTFSDLGDAVAARFQAEIAHGWPPRAETLEQAQAAAKAAWLARST